MSNIKYSYRHYINKYFRSNLRKISIAVIGVGGTGSFLLHKLARLDLALKAYDMAGLHVEAWDPDVFTESNAVRQLMSPAFVGLNKAMVTITNINRYYGFNWEYKESKYDFNPRDQRNIIITCTDNIESRLILYDKKMLHNTQARHEHSPYYWVDIGNKKSSGQVIVSTFQKINQPFKKSGKIATIDYLHDIIDIYPDYLNIKDNDTPSCSARESLSKQGLFINETLAIYASELIRALLFELYLTVHGVFIDLESLNTSLLNVKKRIIRRRVPTNA